MIDYTEQCPITPTHPTLDHIDGINDARYIILNASNLSMAPDVLNKLTRALQYLSKQVDEGLEYHRNRLGITK